ncbi:MAG TPA: DinB family protein [Bryobacteraceae bacterium]|nr:DinB family protein [Bryobacteraceae bacterium]
MSVSADALRLHLDYTAWASRRLVAAAAQLSAEELQRDFGTADKSVLGTLVHVFGADRIWLARLEGKPPGSFLTEADYLLSVLENDWPALHERWKQWAAGLTDEVVRRVVTYHDTKGREWSQPLWQPLLHVVNHATHHRGQVSGFLRAMGHAPPVLDLVAYYRTVAA